MKPTRTELLLAWMTLVKVLEHYDAKQVDECDQQMIRSVLKLLNDLQDKEK
jgi:hypothetical protein